VEDDDSIREGFMDLIRRKGFQAIGANTVDQALREIRSMPSIDIVITDMDLHEHGRADTAGETLAKEIKKRRSDLPIVAYTAHDQDDYLSRIDWSVFDFRLEKAAPDREEQGIDECRIIALRRRGQRLATAISELQRLQTKYEIGDEDVQILRQFLPGIHFTAGNEVGGEHSEFETVDQLLRRLGFRLGFIHAGAHGMDDAGERIMTRITVPAWFQTTGGVIVAEVYDYPEIYAEGATDDEAVKAVLALMYGFHKDLGAVVDMRPPVQRLRDYLQLVFGE
jgi:CheY-like chemotaxis protein